MPLALLVLMVADGVRAAPPPRPVAEFPVVWTNTGQLELPVSVNGGEPITFMLDTGAEFSVVSTALAKRLGLRLDRRLGRDFADAVSLAFGGIRLPNQSVMVMSFEGYRKRGRDLQGLIGHDFFTRYVVEIDFEKARLSCGSRRDSRPPRPPPRCPSTSSGESRPSRSSSSSRIGSRSAPTS